MPSKYIVNFRDNCVKLLLNDFVTMWQIETRKQGTEIFVSCKNYCIFVGEGYSQKEKARSLRYASIIVKALNKEDKYGKG